MITYETVRDRVKWTKILMTCVIMGTNKRIAKVLKMEQKFKIYKKIPLISTFVRFEVHKFAV